MINKNDLENEIMGMQEELAEVKYLLGEELWKKDCSYCKTYFPDKYESIKEIEKDIDDKKKQLQKVMMGKLCKECGQELADGSKFCNRCGASVEIQKTNGKICSTCGKELEADALFCAFCGTSVVVKEDNYVNEIKCPSCFAKIESDATFCVVCGTKIEINNNQDKNNLQKETEQISVSKENISKINFPSQMAADAISQMISKEKTIRVKKEEMVEFIDKYFIKGSTQEEIRELKDVMKGSMFVHKYIDKPRHQFCVMYQNKGFWIYEKDTRTYYQLGAVMSLVPFKKAVNARINQALQKK